MKILGLEHSCDETAVAIVDGDGVLLAHKLVSQQEHLEYGGVVPEIAARAHVDAIDTLYLAAMDEAGLTLKDIDAVACCTGPGLIGGLIVGSVFAKALAGFGKKPFISVNHLQAHALMARMGSDLEFPFMLLLVSGGHTQILFVKSAVDFELLGESIDDACGECFDKVAKIMGLAYPGGPKIEALAKLGDSKKYVLPRPLIREDNCNFSFSGLKSASLKLVNDLQPLDDKKMQDISATFQQAVCDVVAVKILKALVKLQEAGREMPTALVVSGGAGANMAIRGELEKIAAANSMKFIAPPLKLCMDNGVMIAWAGVEMFRLGKFADLSTECRPRWALNLL